MTGNKDIQADILVFTLGNLSCHHLIRAKVCRPFKLKGVHILDDISFPRKIHVKLHRSVVSLFLSLLRLILPMCQKYSDIYVYIVKELSLLKIQIM